MMQLISKIFLVVIMILSWVCFVEEFANYYFLYRGERTRFRIWVFFTIGIMDTFLFIEYFFLK